MKVTKQRVVTSAGFILSSLLLIFAASCSFQKRAADDSGAKKTENNPAGLKAEKKTFIANQFCSACHYSFAEEELARNHAAAGIGCERCHGESERHRSDEDNVTPPEIMYPRTKIVPMCMMCHPRHEISHVKHHERLLAGAKTVFDSDPKDADSQITCTTCHAKKHRINVRTKRWDKATGELLKE